MFKKAGIDVSSRKITNHSTRVTQVTTLLNKGCDDFDIKTRSGHRSSAADRYKSSDIDKRPDNKRKFEMSSKLDVTSPVNQLESSSKRGRNDDKPATSPRFDQSESSTKNDHDYVSHAPTPKQDDSMCERCLCLNPLLRTTNCASKFLPVLK